jgi:hypothetical protein
MMNVTRLTTMPNMSEEFRLNEATVKKMLTIPTTRRCIMNLIPTQMTTIRGSRLVGGHSDDDDDWDIFPPTQPDPDVDYDDWSDDDDRDGDEP